MAGIGAREEREGEEKREGGGKENILKKDMAQKKIDG